MSSADTAIARWNADEKATSAEMGACERGSGRRQCGKRCFSLGVVFVKGQGVPQNADKAVEWFARRRVPAM